MSQDPYNTGSTGDPGGNTRPFDYGNQQNQNQQPDYTQLYNNQQPQQTPGYSQPQYYQQPMYMQPAVVPVSPVVPLTPQQIEANKAEQVSLVCGIIALVCTLFGITALLGFIMGIVAIMQAGKADKLGGVASGGRIMGWISVVLSGLVLALFILWIIFFFLLAIAASSSSYID